MDQIIIFTDASTNCKYNLSFIGYVLLDSNKNIITEKCKKIKFNKDTNKCEEEAIKQALTTVYMYCKYNELLNENITVNVFSDSKVSIGKFNNLLLNNTFDDSEISNILQNNEIDIVFCWIPRKNNIYIDKKLNMFCKNYISKNKTI